MSSAVYAEVEIQDALLKISLYLNAMVGKGSPQRHEKAVALATQTFFKFMDNEEFAKDCFEKAKAAPFKSNYYVLLFVDQMLKNSKLVFKVAKRELESIFRAVWEQVWMEPENREKLETLKLMARVWGCVVGQRTQEGIKKFVEQNYKTKLTLSPQRQAELMRQYGRMDNPTPGAKSEQLMHGMEQQGRKPSNSNDKLLQALGFDEQ